MTKIKGTEKQELLQIIIQMIRPLQMVICKEDCPSDDQNQRDGGARIVANDHLDDPASYVPLQRVICKEDGPPDDQHFLVE